MYAVLQKPGITAFFGKAAAGKKALVDAPASSSQAASEDDSQVPHRAVVNGQEGSNPEYGGKPNSIPDPDAKSDVKPGLHPYVKAELDVKQEEDLKSEAEDHGVSAADREENSGERLSQTASAGLDLASASQPAVEQQEHHGALQHRKQQGTQSMQARQHQPLPAAVDARAETAGGIGASAAHTAQPPTDPAAGPGVQSPPSPSPPPPPRGRGGAHTAWQNPYLRVPVYFQCVVTSHLCQPSPLFDPFSHAHLPQS